MGLIATMPKKELPPAENLLAYCYSIIDMGVQKTSWQDKESKVHQVQFYWEFPNELMEDGRPFGIWNTYTFSSDPRARLAIHIGAWRGKPVIKYEKLDVEPYLGQFCYLLVKYSEDGQYANVGSISAVPKEVVSSLKKIKPHNELKYLELGDNFDQDVFESLPDFVQEKIAGRLADNYEHLRSIEDKEIHSRKDREDEDIPDFSLEDE